jgi:hypothetical protein
MRIRKRILAIFGYFVAAYFGGMLLKNTTALPIELIKLSAAYLLLLNGTSMLLGLPLSIIFDMLLFKALGSTYLLYWPLIVGVISALHVVLIRTLINRSAPLLIDRARSGATRKMLGEVLSICHNNSRLLVLLLRTIPLMPFTAASGLISLLSIRKSSIFLLSALGSYFYYLTFYTFFSLGTLG